MYLWRHHLLYPSSTSLSYLVFLISSLSLLPLFYTIVFSFFCLLSCLPPPSPSVLEVVVTSIVGQLLETVSSEGTDEQCISHLASLSGVSPSSISDTTHSDISGECDYVSVNRALA